jgi:MerR family transcriptional regulator/heat shock protein HspR
VPDRRAPQDRERWEEVLDDPEQPLYTVGVVADLMGVDPQVVRGYDKRGLVEPGRSESGHRRYSRRDIRRLSRAVELSDEGIPAAGIERILELEDELGRRDAEGADGPDAGTG